MPDLLPPDIESFFKATRKWKGHEKSKSRVGAAMQVAEVTRKQVEDIFEAGSAIWKHLGSIDDTIAALDYRSPDANELNAIVEAQLRHRFPEVFEKQCRGEEEESFICKRAPGMVAYRTWHHWSRKERKQARRNRGGGIATGTVPLARDGDDKISEEGKNGTIDPAADDTATPLTKAEGLRHNRQVSELVCKLADRPLIVEIYSAKDKDELLRLDLKHLLIDEEDEHAQPNFDKLEAQLRGHPLITALPEGLIFIHVYGNDKNTFIYNQATLETAFEEWKEKGIGFQLGPFRLYVVSEVNCLQKPAKISLA